MTIDHIGGILFPHVLVLRLIGRLALPCFLFGIYEGTHRTRNHTRYVMRIIGLGILSMPITTYPINVLFLFALFSLSIKYKGLFFPCLIASYFTEYGVYGFLLGWAIVWASEKNITEGTLMGLLLTPLSGNAFQLLSGLMIPVFTLKWRLAIPRGPKLFFYLYYPLHLLVIRLIARV